MLTMSNKRSNNENLSMKPSKRSKISVNVGNTSKRKSIDNNSLVPAKRINQSQGLNSNNTSCSSEKSRYPRHGQVMSISLTNFMSHNHFQISFDKRINLISGKNGSGKSAIMTALIVGLGGRATDANRGNSVKTFIKDNERSAKIEVTVCNRNGYATDRFGEYFTIIRNITPHQSSYKIRYECGHSEPLKLTDLNVIKRALNICINNPVCMLTQDAARSFLADTNPKKRFEFFMKATNLYEIEENIEEDISQYHSMSARLDAFISKKDTLVEELSSVRNQYVNLISKNEMKNLLKQLNLEYAWSLVFNEENEIQLMAKLEEEYRTSIKELDASKSSRQKTQMLITEKINKLQRDEDELLKQSNAEEMKIMKINEEMKNIQDEKDYQQAERAKLETQVSNCKENIEVLTKAISERSGSKSADNINELYKMCKETEDMLNDAIAVKTNMEQEIIQTRNMLQEHQNDVTKLSENIRHYDRLIATNTDRINAMKRSTNNSLMVFGQDMCNFKNDVNKLYNMGKFVRQPIGPIGSCIKVPDPKWRLLVESTLSGLVFSFITHCAEDRNMITNLKNKKYPNLKCKIYTTNFDVPPVQNNGFGVERAPDCFQFMDITKIESNVIYALLVDLRKVQHRLYCQSIETAANLAADENLVPNNLSYFMVAKPFSVVYPAPQYRMYRNKAYTPKYIETDKGGLIKGFIQENKAKEAEKLSLQTEKSAIVNKLNQLKDLLAKHKIDLVSISSNIDGLKRKHEKLLAEQNELCSGTIISSLMHDLEKEKSKMTNIQNQLSELIVIEPLDSHTDQILAIKRQLAKLSKAIEAKRKEIEKCHQSMKESVDNISYQLSQMKNTLNETITLRQSCLDKKKKLVTDAQKLGDELRSNKSTDELKKEIKNLSRKLNEIQISNDICVSEIKEKKDTLETQLAQFESYCARALKFRDAKREVLKSRKRAFLKLRSNFANFATHYFTKCLALKDMGGTLFVDFKECIVDLKVIPRVETTDETTAVKSLKQLSGGEKSFSTVSFLVALWSTTNFPFYMLDEYDVFTDPYTRGYITKLLQHQAKQKRTSQFAFLTPQSIEFFSDDEELLVHRLMDPILGLQ